MVIFLYGADSYRRNGKLRELVQSYKNKHEEIDLLLIDLEDEPDSWARARDFLNQPSLFLNSKVLIVREAASVEEKEWLAVLKRELETPKSFVLVSDRGKPPRKFGFLLKGPAVSQSFPELEGASLKIFLQKKFFQKDQLCLGVSGCVNRPHRFRYVFFVLEFCYPFQVLSGNRLFGF